MNRTTCQNQGAQRCGTRTMNSENQISNMRAAMPCQMRTRNASQACGQSPRSTEENRAGERSEAGKNGSYRLSQDCRNMDRCLTSDGRSTDCPHTQDARSANRRLTSNGSGRGCGCTGDNSPEENGWRQEVPTDSRKKLLTYIDEVSFGAYEALLYLDTHPNCADGLHYFKENNEKRQFALKEYTRLYGPLNLDRVQLTCDTPTWEWVNQPWPWEGGAC